ncbi:hypothetical protein RCL_jg8007.t1 [Rhizophagus clarus]|uniref:Uncharacterized protein n=1 Tax=Rhizophagus clarus TaxID=94130 RepID=A0A8H3MHJ1_9GLOM|nr:hypothetical protein RCL_jg8007.t1 [Rhizophagus clarus]
MDKDDNKINGNVVNKLITEMTAVDIDENHRKRPDSNTLVRSVTDSMIYFGLNNGFRFPSLVTKLWSDNISDVCPLHKNGFLVVLEFYVWKVIAIYEQRYARVEKPVGFLDNLYISIEVYVHASHRTFSCENSVEGKITILINFNR